MARMLPKRLLVLGLVCTLVVCTLYYLLTLSPSIPSPLSSNRNMLYSLSPNTTPSSLSHESCSSLKKYPADIETADMFPTLELEPDWMERREYWGSQMEDRFQRRKPLWPQLPLRVIVMPHSHNDPGWLKTVEGYFATATKNIINNMVDKLTEHRNMTFIWTEMSYLSMWWEVAQPDMREKLRSLLDSGRLEIPTGGWVMTDEANVELFSMVEQLVEGHSFLRSTLNVKPLSSWSVDSFGHGGTFPHLLAKSGISNMVIMRVHYAWKEWLARYQQGDFLWKQSWEPDGSSAPLCHNFPYDIYSIKHSCGPHPQTCLGFDFRHVAGEYNEFSLHYTPIDKGNLQNRAELLLEQYGRTGSLLPHNVVLVPLGDDFRYNNAAEFDQQYSNYIQLMEFINSHEYHAKVTFGTLSDYFSEVRARMSKFNTLTGDFFVYSDIFSEGRPAYWSGYFSTRPFLKQLSRHLASQLRSTEILYTIAVGLARKVKSGLPLGIMHSSYDQLVEARRHLGLFQHHDAITGTSKAFVMSDYQQKLLSGLSTVKRITEMSAQYLLQQDKEDMDKTLVLKHLEWREDGGEAHGRVLDMIVSKSEILVVFNSLVQDREEVVSLMINSASVCVKDSTGTIIDSQITPTYNTTGTARLDLGVFDLVFVATIPALSLASFTLSSCDRGDPLHQATRSRVFCLRCPNSEQTKNPFTLASLPTGAVQLENHVYTLLFDPVTKLLRNVTNKLSGHIVPLDMEFTAYPSTPFRSGAYLFSVEESSLVESGPVFTSTDLMDVVIVSGPVFAQLMLVWKVAGEAGDSTFVTRYRLYHTTGPTSEGVQVENMFDFGPSPNMRDRELVMRLKTGVRSNRRFYTDQSGLGVIKREWAEQAGLEGNHFPITQAAYLQDEQHRVTLLVDHATGASSVEEGWLEVMVDRRTVYDDARGMGEGVLDSRATTHKYWLMVEPKDPSYTPSPDTLPSLSPLATILSRQLDNPLTVLQSSSPDPPPQVHLIDSALPCDHHLLNLRSWTPRQPSPSPSALLLLQRHAPDCSWASLSLSESLRPAPAPHLHFTRLPAIFHPTSLTGNFPTERETGDLFKLAPMEVASYNVTFS
eukprot:GFUD01045601.1.p1 GENE.GFUD01045601.1~~GFUD01045601.1.p1  ORF type:complete len:1094 (+),score=331.94 GFUD01045601.1:211-3492(+)